VLKNAFISDTLDVNILSKIKDEKMNNKRVIILSLFSAIIVAGGFAQTQYNGKATVAMVQYNTSEPITAEQLRTQVEMLEKQAGRTSSDQDRQKVLDGMIDQRLVIQAAAKEKITVSEAEINQQIQGMKNQMAASVGRPPSDDEFYTAIKQQTGIDKNVYREQMKQQMLISKYIAQKYLPQVLSKANVAVSDSEVNEQIQELKNQLTRSSGGRQPTDAEFSAAIKQQTGMELEAFKTTLKTQLAQQKYLLSLGGGKPTDDDISTALRANPSNFHQDGYIQCYYIAVPFGAAQTKAKAKETADKIAKEIGTSESEFLLTFTKIKDRNDPQNYQNCQAGTEYFIQSTTLQMMNKEFFDMAFPSTGADNQGVRKVSKLVETPQAYIVIYILKREKGKDLGLTDNAPEYLGMGVVTVKDYINAMLLQSRMSKGEAKLSENLTDELRKSATIKTFPQYINW
jgi:hypothetical protein